MSWNNNWIALFLLAGLISFCSAPAEKQQEIADSKTIPFVPSTTYLLDISEVNSVIERPGYKLIDFRKPAEYEAGHLPGAINIWRSDIEIPEFEYGGMMASRFQLETLFSEKGIQSSDTLVIYDDNGLCDAARLWWVLQNQNFEAVKLLHGGMRGWHMVSDSVSVLQPSYEPSNFQFAYPEEQRFVISKEQVLQGMSKNFFVIDARSADEYSGKRQKKGASKGGRIPGSVNIDWASAIDYHGDLKIKGFEELLSTYYQLPASKEDPIIVYCHSGVRSAHTTFVLTQVLGYKDVRNYDGSWTEWSYFDDLPVEKDSITTIID